MEEQELFLKRILLFIVCKNSFFVYVHSIYVVVKISYFGKLPFQNVVTQ